MFYFIKYQCIILSCCSCQPGHLKDSDFQALSSGLVIYLISKNLLEICFSFIYIYISYANIAWASTPRKTFHANRFDHSRPLLKEMKSLNVYQISLIQTLKFIHKIEYGINPRNFFLHFLRQITNVRDDFPKTASIIKNLLVKPLALQ